MSSVHPVLSAFTPFFSLSDPRRDQGKRHLFTDIFVIALCGVICGVDNCEELEEFGESKQSWFSTFLPLPHGIPSQDTFLRVFSALDPTAFAACFQQFIEKLRNQGSGQVVAIDGKTLRHSFNTASEKLPIHMVSAWLREEGLVLGQMKTEEKSNEITSIPKLLQLLQIQGCTVTTDAMGCQKEIVKTIKEKEAEYVLQVKENQPSLYQDIADYFDKETKDSLRLSTQKYLEIVEKDHGRIEERVYFHSNDISWFEDQSLWNGLQGFGMVTSRRTHLLCGKTEEHTRYFITSFPQENVHRFADAVRGHWSIENQLHWVLDVAFLEDQSRMRTKNLAQNFAILRHASLSLLKQEKQKKKGILTKRKRCGWDHDYLLQVMGLRKPL